MHIFMKHAGIFLVPTKLNVLHTDERHIVYDPVTGIYLCSSCMPILAENYAMGFLEAMKGYAEHGYLFNNRWMDNTQEYQAYMLGMKDAAKICEMHIRNGGIIAIEDENE